VYTTTYAFPTANGAKSPVAQPLDFRGVVLLQLTTMIAR
jgi:hypothetical protein